LRRRAHLTQRELAIAVGYSEAHISRLEQNQRLPDLAALAALFTPALNLEDEPAILARLMELATAARGQRLPSTGRLSVTRSVSHEISETIEIVEDSPNNLPLQLTSFIGRKAEIAAIQRLLTGISGSRQTGQGVRLVTLIGAGGSGKTRLALQVTAEMLAAFPDGVWFVDLAPLTDPALVPQTVTAVLGVQTSPGDSLLNALVNYTRDKTMLLVLDNCEHVIDVCAQLVETLLRAAPKLKVLATSRETLNLTGETVFNVPSLSTPDPRHRPSLEELPYYEAVRLFVERAEAALPGFTLSTGNALAIVRICHQLDGIPLAIELAAARVKMLRVEEIAARLDDRFHLLTSGNRAALPRHQTLCALIDWSWELLPEPERALLRRLSVFVGGWTLAAAEAVASDQKPVISEQLSVTSKSAPARHGLLVTEDILDLLTRLVNKSLVVGERQPGAEARYWLLESIRHYAREKLDDSGEAEQMRHRHLAFILKLAEEGEPALRGHEQMEWLGRLEGEHDNLRAALSWSLGQNPKAALSLAGALFHFWHIRGYASEGRRWLEAALAVEDQAGALTLTMWRAKALRGAGVLAWFQGDYEAGRAYYQESLTIYRHLGDQAGAGHALYGLATISFWQADYISARLLYEESLAILKAVGDSWGIGNCLYGLGLLAQRAGDSEASRSLLEQSVALLRQAGDRWGLTLPLDYLAWAVWLQGDAARARALYEERLSAYRALGSKFGMANTMSSLSVIAAVHGDYATATALEEEALAMAQEVGNKWQIAWSLVRLSEQAYWQGDLAQARVLCADGMSLFREMNESEASSLLLRSIARILYREGDYVQAEALLKESLALLAERGLKPYMVYTFLDLGDVTRLQGDHEGAANFYRQSLRLQTEQGSLLEVAERVEGLAKVAGLAGQPERAARLFGAAQALRERLGTPRPPVERADYERNLDAVRAALDEDAFTAAWADGQAMTTEQAITYALL
jgi:non-specific serine/threonine protein kinase